MHPEDTQRIAEMQAAVAVEVAERDRAKRAPALRRQRLREQQRQARAAVRADVKAELAQLRPSPTRTGGRGRPSVLNAPGVCALFQRADAEGLTASELAGLFSVGTRTIRAWRSR